MKPTVRLVRGGSSLLLFAAFAGLAAWGQELSHVRIVRLSFTEGTVTLQRADVEEWATAPVNTPIQEGFKVATAEGSFAEVEFENSSTARIGQLSLVEFTQLALLPSGGKVNRLTLKEGYATFNFIPEGDDFYEVAVGDATLRPQGKCRFRVDFDQGILQVKVFKGSVEIASREGNGTLGKNTVLEIHPGEAEPFQISQGITKDAWDEWVEERENRVVMARNHQAAAPYTNNVSELLYGFMDLGFYGDWVSVPGYGYGWAPYVNMGWSPYTLGRWCWYPSFGYTWISTEPWGWLPYHYGSWVYAPGYGWAWIPNNFGSWSPAMVYWYRGPGWVGWAPMSPQLGGGAPAGGGPGLSHCPQPRGCITTVHEDTLRHGWQVLPNRRDDIDAREGRIVERPEIRPERLAQLSGEPRTHAAGYRSGRIENRDVPATGRVIPTRPSVDSSGGTAPASSGIVFDPEQRQYVNNPSYRSAPAPSGGGGGGGAAPATLTVGGRPGPVTNYPVPTATGSSGSRPGFDNRNEPGGDTTSLWDQDEPGWRRGPGQDARAGGSRSSDRNAGSSGRVAPSRETRSSGGSRSSSDRGSSSVGSRSGGDRSGSSSRSDSGSRSSGGNSGGSSSRSSGGWSGGSSGSSRSSGGGSSSSGGSSGGGGGSRSSGGGSSSTSSSGGSHSSSPRR